MDNLEILYNNIMKKVKIVHIGVGVDQLKWFCSTQKDRVADQYLDSFGDVGFDSCH